MKNEYVLKKLVLLWFVHYWNSVVELLIIQGFYVKTFK